MNCHVNKLPCQILCITQRISKYKKMGRSNKFENTLIDEKAMNDFILLRTELMPITSFYPTYWLFLNDFYLLNWKSIRNESA